MYFHAARQPILDINKQLFAYELLFRDGISNAFPEIDGNEATSKIVAGSQFDFSLSDFTGTNPAFINFTLETIAQKFPTLIPKEELVIEILETERPGKRLLAEVKELHGLGYAIALDDYIHEPVWRHFFPFIEFIKVDFLATSLEQVKAICAAVKEFPHIKLLAEKIETNEQYQLAVELGFSYFQGYFFAKPETLKVKSLSPAQFSLAELLYEISKPDSDLPKITQVFEMDVNLSYKLLRYSNSPVFRRRTEISTIKQAIVTLGKVELQKFISVLFSAQMVSDKPPELMAMSLCRAKFLEGLAKQSPKIDSESVAFLTGMMSLIDVIIGENMQSAMEKLPLANEIQAALLNNEGELAQLLAVAKNYEQTRWDSCDSELLSLGVAQDKVPQIYRDAVRWANEQMEFVLSSG